MRRATPNRGRSGAGFTLLELLVALVLLGLISAIALGGIRLGARTWETVGDRAEKNSQIQMVRTFLTRELAQAAAVMADDPEGGLRLAYEGEEDSLVFVAPLAPHFALGGYQRLELSLIEEEAGGGMQLILKRDPFYPDRMPDPARGDEDNEDIHILLDGIEEAAFAYRGDLESEDAEWSADWRERDDMPALVRLRISFADPRRTAWPDLVVARRVTTEPGCLPADRGPGCRLQ